VNAVVLCHLCGALLLLKSVRILIACLPVFFVIVSSLSISSWTPSTFTDLCHIFGVCWPLRMCINCIYSLTCLFTSGSERARLEVCRRSRRRCCLENRTHCDRLQLLAAQQPRLISRRHQVLLAAQQPRQRPLCWSRRPKRNMHNQYAQCFGHRTPQCLNWNDSQWMGTEGDQWHLCLFVCALKDNILELSTSNLLHIIYGSTSASFYHKVKRSLSRGFKVCCQCMSIWLITFLVGIFKKKYNLIIDIID